MYAVLDFAQNGPEKEEESEGEKNRRVIFMVSSYSNKLNH